MMLRGQSRIGSIVLGLGLLFSSPSFALENVIIPKNQTATHQLDHGHQISGAYGMQNYFFAVNDKDPVIYQLNFVVGQSGKKVTTLVPYKKLEELYGYYAYAKSIPGNKKFDLEGVTSCSNNGMLFYLVNEKTGDILRVDSKNLTKLNINYDNYPDFNYDLGNDGFMGVTADCANNKLYVAKLKNPNIVFEVDLIQGRVVRQFNMSTGSDSEDDISDLFFKNGQLYVLQKNITSIAVVDPTIKNSNFVTKRLDYSSMSDLTKIDEIGIAEGLVVQNSSVFLFLDQRKVNKANDDRSKDVIVELKI